MGSYTEGFVTALDELLDMLRLAHFGIEPLGEVWENRQCEPAS